MVGPLYSPFNSFSPAVISTDCAYIRNRLRSIYTRENCVQYGGFTRKKTRVKFYTNNYKQCKVLQSVSKTFRVFFTRVFRACISCVICVQYGGFTLKKHACNAAMLMACTVVIKAAVLAESSIMFFFLQFYRPQTG